MKIKRILFLTLSIFLLIGMAYICKGESMIPADTTIFKQLAEEYNINLEDYPYWFAIKSGSSLMIYHSQERINVRLSHGRYYNYGSPSAFKIIMKDNSLSGEIINMSTNPLIITNTGDYVALNHNIYCEENVLFAKNAGYEYDATQEGEETYNDIMQVKNETKVYDGAAINYDEISTLSTGDVVKRIKRAVNEKNGHKWDKVKLSNGIEGYVFTENLETTEGYEKVEVQYNDKIYEICFNPSKYGINIEDYPYYFVTKYNSEIAIYYSQERITTRLSHERYYNSGSSSVLEIVVNKNGSLTGKIIDMSNDKTIVRVKSDYVVANHDIYCEEEIICNACIYIENGELAFKTRNDWENIQVRYLAYGKIQKGEEEYNSMPEAEKIIKWTNLQIAHGEIYAAAVAATLAGYPNGGSALIYYLSSGEKGGTGETEPYEEGVYTNGHTRRMVSLPNAINEWTLMQQDLEKNINIIKQVTKRFGIPENSSITFCNSIERAGGTSIYHGTDATDWFITLGTYRIKMQCTVTKNKNKYELNMRYGLEDYYDWNRDEDANIDTILEMILKFNPQIYTGSLSKILEDLHRMGLARNYTNYGETTYTTTWNG